MRRVLAIVAAGVMVAASLAVRSRMDQRRHDSANPVRVVCAQELGDVCRAIRGGPATVVVEAAGTTAARLGQSSDDDAGLDGWLVPAPWPQIVNEQRRGRSAPPLFAEGDDPLARSLLVLVAWKLQADQLGPRCPGGQLGWKCLGDSARSKEAKPGHGDPASDGVATLVVGQAVMAYFGRPDLSRSDLDDPGFEAWFTALENSSSASQPGGSALELMLATRTAYYDAVGTTEAEAAPLLARSATAKDYVLLYPSPPVTADVVLADRVGASGGRVRSAAGGHAVRKALSDAGWRVSGISRPPGEPPLPAKNGLPAPGFLDAVRNRAREVSGR